MHAVPLARWALAISLGSTSVCGLTQNQTDHHCGAIYSDRPCPQSVTISSSDAHSGAQKVPPGEAAVQRVAPVQVRATAVKARVKASAPDREHRPGKKHKDPTVIRPIATLPLKNPKKSATGPTPSDAAGAPQQALDPKP